MKLRNSAEIELKFIGGEPRWDSPKTNLVNALSWYANQYGPKESKKYTLDYLKKNKFDKAVIEKIADVDDWRFGNLGFCCRVVTNGAQLNENQLDWIEAKINQLAASTEKELIISEFEKPKESVSIQDRIYIQCNSYISDIEDIIDQLIATKRKVDFNPYDWMTKNDIKAVHAKQIIEHFIPTKEELVLAISKKDPDLVEGYSNFKKNELKLYHDLIESIIDDCDKIINNKKITRKPKKKKAVSLDKKVSKVQYKKDDIEYKLASINPIDIVGAKQLWVFNTKTKKLGFYLSNDDTGFGVKGTTLENYDELLSIQKTLRKPLDILPNVLKAKKTELKKIMSGINSKEAPLNGRINSDTILLKVIK
jgi:hypothetical protein